MAVLKCIAPSRKSPAAVERVATGAAHIDSGTLKRKCDAARLLIGFASAMRRSEFKTARRPLLMLLAAGATLTSSTPTIAAECQRGFKQLGDGCVAVQVPKNAEINVFGNGWTCQRGFKQLGDGCVAVQVPKNAEINVFGNGWTCQRGFKQLGDGCVAVQVPKNAEINVFGNGWTCQRGFKQLGDGCVAVQVPKNAEINVFGNGWTCQRGFKQLGDGCVAVQVPKNAEINVFGNGWTCQRGFKQLGDGCVAVQVPKNAEINVFGNGWSCQRGFKQLGDGCVRMTKTEQQQQEAQEKVALERLIERRAGVTRDDCEWEYDSDSQVCVTTADASLDCSEAYDGSSYGSCEVEISYDVVTNFEGDGELAVEVECTAEVAYRGRDAYGWHHDSGDDDDSLSLSSLESYSGSITVDFSFGLYQDVIQVRVESAGCEIESVEHD